MYWESLFFYQNKKKICKFKLYLVKKYKTTQKDASDPQSQKALRSTSLYSYRCEKRWERTGKVNTGGRCKTEQWTKHERNQVKTNQRSPNQTAREHTKGNVVERGSVLRGVIPFCEVRYALDRWRSSTVEILRKTSFTLYSFILFLLVRPLEHFIYKFQRKNVKYIISFG